MRSLGFALGLIPCLFFVSSTLAQYRISTIEYISEVNSASIVGRVYRGHQLDDKTCVIQSTHPITKQKYEFTSLVQGDHLCVNNIMIFNDNGEAAIVVEGVDFTKLGSESSAGYVVYLDTDGKSFANVKLPNGLGLYGKEVYFNTKRQLVFVGMRASSTEGALSFSFTDDKGKFKTFSFENMAYLVEPSGSLTELTAIVKEPVHFPLGSIGGLNNKGEILFTEYVDAQTADASYLSVYDTQKKTSTRLQLNGELQGLGISDDSRVAYRRINNTVFQQSSLLVTEEGPSYASLLVSNRDGSEAVDIGCSVHPSIEYLADVRDVNSFRFLDDKSFQVTMFLPNTTDWSLNKGHVASFSPSAESVANYCANYTVNVDKKCNRIQKNFGFESSKRNKSGKVKQTSYACAVSIKAAQPGQIDAVIVSKTDISDKQQRDGRAFVQPRESTYYVLVDEKSGKGRFKVRVKARHGASLKIVSEGRHVLPETKSIFLQRHSITDKK